MTIFANTLAKMKSNFGDSVSYLQHLSPIKSTDTVFEVGEQCCCIILSCINIDVFY